MSIRILEKENNKRGDLFGRLMADLFVALGYEQPRLNVHKSGRELDLTAIHRLEIRRAIAECKATAEPIGGDDLNKFVGVLDAERDDKLPLTGYFISLNGFKETAVEQEQQRKNKIVTLTGTQVVDELIDGRIVIAKERATEVAGRLCGVAKKFILDTDVELLAHQRGLVWAIYYTQGKARTHFALVHSDGTPLARAIADEVIKGDRNCGGTLYKLSCLNPEPEAEGDDIASALAAYRQYIANECGYIQLDGLPADSDVGSRRLALENLFVPLHVDVQETDKKVKRQPVGEVLSRHSRLALLAPPGGGKSTLIKRLAVAYADPARRDQVTDELPATDRLPLFFRCRELRDLARGSFAELLDALAQRESVRRHAAAFRAHVDRELLAGRALLLVDGLDEIADPGDRAAFVCTLRAAMNAYPGIAMVVTSREAGFRHVAAHVSSVCVHATLSPFDDDDVTRLTVAWHQEVLGDTEKVRNDAEALAKTIVQNDRIKRLAVNPLLLTTLLLVKRWVGSLPTRRAVLYGKAVELLLMTWNTEGHEPIPQEEALPQLCYVASAMMFDGVQKISRTRLADLLQQARAALPTELGYVKESVDQFIHRVEDRSSLLMMTGLDVEDGQLLEFFEFRHLTFQEFLTARAMVEGWYPGRKDNETLADMLESHFNQEAWREVIPLAAVLGGKATEGLILRLTDLLAGIDPTKPVRALSTALLNCLADEAGATPQTIRRALRELVRFGSSLFHREGFSLLARGKYGADLYDEAAKAFQQEGPNLTSAADSLIIAIWERTIGQGLSYLEAAERFVTMTSSSDSFTRCEGAMGAGRLAWVLNDKRSELKTCASTLRRALPALEQMINVHNKSENLAACYALEMLGLCDIPDAPTAAVLARLVEIWSAGSDQTVQSLAARAIATQKLAPRETMLSCGESTRALFRGVPEQGDDERMKFAQLVVAWYLEAVPDSQIAAQIKDFPGNLVSSRRVHEFQTRLGVPLKKTRPARKRSAKSR